MEDVIHLQEDELVTGIRRFLHYVLDIIIFNILYFPIDQAIAAKFNPENDPQINLSIGLFFYMIFFVLYYIIFELLIQRSPGKYLTGSFVVNEYGEKPGFKSIVIRNMIRIVPFEIFSCINDRGWHDKWSGTMVITRAAKNRIEALQTK